MNKETPLKILVAERDNAKSKLEDRITSMKSTLENLELMLKNNEKFLYASDGLQGNYVDIDIYLNKVITYNRAIELLKKEEQ